MNKQEVLDAMILAGLQSPKVMLANVFGNLCFDLYAGPTDPPSRKSWRVAVKGGRNCKALPDDVTAAIEALR